MLDREYVKLNYKGQEININRVFAGHRFDDSELKHLEQGETIHIQAKKKNGDAFDCDGHIEKQSYNGFSFWGFKMIPFKQKEKAEGMFAGVEVKFNRVYSQHRFTDSEVQDLLAGKVIHIHGKTKTGRDFECDGKLAQREYEGRKFWGFDTVETADNTPTPVSNDTSSEKPAEATFGNDFSAESSNSNDNTDELF